MNYASVHSSLTGGCCKSDSERKWTVKICASGGFPVLQARMCEFSLGLRSPRQQQSFLVPTFFSPLEDGDSSPPPYPRLIFSDVFC
ncbi:hypothetical protein L596_019118 [Steinernema carpocapsae]|uniref:Uncharacterized protein n=1 Tax=Steinernema carpocapsae TaxID=34508 RepID=A0A4U5N6W5_STECR|nr:hypothetical protein L596_019118 [Steinernema carpocapsae]